MSVVSLPAPDAPAAAAAPAGAAHKMLRLAACAAAGAADSPVLPIAVDGAFGGAGAKRIAGASVARAPGARQPNGAAVAQRVGNVVIVIHSRQHHIFHATSLLRNGAPMNQQESEKIKHHHPHQTEHHARNRGGDAWLHHECARRRTASRWSDQVACTIMRWCHEATVLMRSTTNVRGAHTKRRRIVGTSTYG